jgi:hypothetical protein
MADSVVEAASGGLTVRAFRGDAKTLLAFDLPAARTNGLAGFTVFCQPPGQPGFYLENSLRYANTAGHAQVLTESPNASINAPLHKFRWVHVADAPGAADPVYGTYVYTVTPRYVDDHDLLLPIDASLGAGIDFDVGPFTEGSLSLAFTRGYTQSQAFVKRYGHDARIQPPAGDPDTSKQAGTAPDGTPYTYAEEYAWLGSTARKAVFDLVDEVIADPSLRLDLFAYDLREPDFIARLLQLANAGRVRVILDNSADHHDAAADKPEDHFETSFRQAAQPGADILRGKFGRYAHDKVLIVSGAAGPVKVLTGSTNFAVTGLYVNSNHVLVFDDATVAAKYAELFAAVWAGQAELGAFLGTALTGDTASFGPPGLPSVEITFAPHEEPRAKDILNGIVQRIGAESAKPEGGNVLFAVMELADDPAHPDRNPVYNALNQVHSDGTIFSYGVSDDPDGISLYEPGKTTGVLVTGKPVDTQLPPPFDQVPGVGLGHQVHHKFVVCGFRDDDAVVYCGSSNLALGGEERNGDNLLAVHDRDVATAFAIEAVLLVDHFQFLDRYSSVKPAATPPADRQAAAASAGWPLSLGAGWVQKYYDQNDLYCVDRQLFA